MPMLFQFFAELRAFTSARLAPTVSEIHNFSGTGKEGVDGCKCVELS